MKENLVLNKDSKRLMYLDIAKGIGIILVVIGHTSSSLTKYIYQFHMPLFFFISGFLFSKKKPVKNYVVKKIESLYIPYVLCNLVVYIPLAIIENQSIQRILIKTLKIIFLLDGAVLLGATWFIASLFWISILFRISFYICDRFNVKKYNILYMIIMIFGVIGLYTHLPFKISTMMTGFAFFCLGYILKSNINKNISVKLKVILSIISLLVIISFAQINNIEMSQSIYTYKILFIISSMCGIFLILTMSSVIEKMGDKALSYIGKNSIYILILHFIAFKIVILFQIYIYNDSLTKLNTFPILYYNNGWWIVYSVIGVFVPLILGGMWQRVLKYLKMSTLRNRYCYKKV